ncbi:MAG TPA: hypothetical protein VFW87_09525 [Pirellulales bacterium]|nr:hypothetical protein [Pirellulales bacterium]
MTSTRTTDRIVTARAKVWSGRGVTRERFSVAPNGTVRAWDSVAGHYTTCHSMSDAAMARIRKLAN